MVQAKHERIKLEAEQQAKLQKQAADAAAANPAPVPVAAPAASPAATRRGASKQFCCPRCGYGKR